MRRMTNVLLGASALALLGGGAAWADVTIATAGPMTGQYAVFGEQMKHGAELAVKDINAKGGVNGEMLVLEVGDDAGPAVSHHRGGSAAGLEVAVEDSELHGFAEVVDVERDRRTAFGREHSAQPLVDATRGGPLGRIGVPRVREPAIGIAVDHDLIRVDDRDVSPELCGDQRGLVPARAATEDHDPVVRASAGGRAAAGGRSDPP